MDTKSKINIFDVLIIIIALTVVSIFLLKGVNETSSTITVKCNGDIYRYSLNKDQIITLNGAIGPTILEIKDHSVAITKSPCKNQTCVHLGWIKRPNSFIACVPGKILVTVDGKNDLEVDDVAH